MQQRKECQNRDDTDQSDKNAAASRCGSTGTENQKTSGTFGRPGASLPDYRKSIDARKKPELSLVYSVEVSASGEEKIIKRTNDPNVTIVKQTGYICPGRFRQRRPSGR